MAEIDHTVGEVAHAMNIYKMFLDINPNHQKVKIKYSDVAFHTEKQKILENEKTKLAKK